ALSIGAGSTGAGSFVFHGTGNTLSGNVATAQSLRLEGVGCINSSATLTAASGFTNAGTIVLDDAPSGCAPVTLTVSSGTLTNTGAITTATTGAGLRTINATLVNSGTVAINTDTTFTGSYTTTGSVTVASGKTLTLGGTTPGFTVSGGSLQVDGTLDSSAGLAFTQDGGTTTVNGIFTMATGSFTFNGGSFAGNAPVLANVALTIGAGSTGAGSFTLHGVSNTISGTVAAAQSLRLEGVGCINSSSTLTAAAGFTNAGSIVLDNNPGGCAPVTLTVNAGTLTNTGSITTGATGGGSRTINATLNNLGTLTSNASLTVNGDVANGGPSTAGTINPGGVGAAGCMTINGNYTQLAGGILNVDVGGTSVCSQFDRMTISGTAGVDGTLNAAAINGFNPVAGDFIVLTASSLSGTFATTNLPPTWVVFYDLADVRLQAQM
ncbi:MAG: hypothetical protein QOF51_2691, partial [Chloroflexota bacterium]|nr:hypothetical protein [Chloroflexota bacterium]